DRMEDNAPIRLSHDLRRLHEPAGTNSVLGLAITRIPSYLRTTRAEVREVRERMVGQAARVMGASDWRIGVHHVLPVVFPALG
ncbi:ABC transporter permease subunit, partial [Rhizobium ruizarguesonis]